ncbi:hypothetical protein EVG20_g7423 [Dentipellis fragilis]|uniref:Methyltransferase domain-containing protein n=1 Tax=Dentipellis fragilis TaxID=205917 RepID=A0A4Y9YDY5_9AGAM|nr:hypothetical protein EVG20_g7423 [Dentipellis fragilis]
MTETSNLPLDENLYHLSPEQKDFFQKTTGIRDGEELKKHILAIQKKAYAVSMLPAFTYALVSSSSPLSPPRSTLIPASGSSRISGSDKYPVYRLKLMEAFRLTVTELEGYNKLLKLARERRGAIFVDIGCCFGNVARKAVLDGFPVENIVASDLNPEFWEFGHELFKTTLETFPVPFIAGDIFNPNHLDLAPLLTQSPTEPRPDLSSLTSLNPLRGHVSAIHAADFFHLFTEEKQVELARKFAGLLSPEPGSIIFGNQLALTEKGWLEENASGSGWKLFCHCPDSWKELWDGIVFPKGTVKVEASLFDIEIMAKNAQGVANDAPSTSLKTSKMTKRTRKVGVTGKYGTASILRPRVTDSVKRQAVGIWKCSACRKVIAGGAWTVSTTAAATVRSTIRRLREITEA